MATATQIPQSTGAPLTVLSEEERMFRDVVRKFARERIGPHVREMDEAGVFRKELLHEMFELGLMGIEIPEEFPLDKVESASDYNFVRLATADQYMLPVHAETLSCERGSPVCSRNAIDFRNYHKYSGEANIVFDK